MRRNLFLMSLLIISLLTVFMPAVLAVEATSSSCGTVNSNLTLSQSINATGTCFEINASNILIDGNGFYLIGDNATGSIGINLTDASDNVTVKNFAEVSNFSTSVIIDFASNYNFLTNLTLNSTGEDTISISGSNNNITNSALDGQSNNNGVVHLAGSASDNLFQGNNIFSSLRPSIYINGPRTVIDNNNISWTGSVNGAIYFQASDVNITNNTITAVGNSAIFHVGGTGNLVEGNDVPDGYLLISTADSNRYINNSFNETGSGLIINGDAQSNHFERNTFESASSNPIKVQDGEGSYFLNNSYVKGSDDEVVRVTSGSATFVNEPFDKNNVSFSGGAVGQLEFIWFVDVLVNGSFGPVNSAYIEINQSNGSLTHNQTTLADGLIRFNVSEGIFNESGWTYYTPHTFFANATSYNTVTETLNLTVLNSTSLTLSLVSDFAVATNDSCGFVNDDLVLNQNISTTGTCFKLNASGVTIDGNGFSLFGDNSTGLIGINVTNASNVTITGFSEISNFSQGITSDSNSLNLWVNNVTVNTTGEYALLVAGQNSNVTNSTFDGSSSGVVVQLNGQNVIAEDNNFFSTLTSALSFTHNALINSNTFYWDGGSNGPVYFSANNVNFTNNQITAINNNAIFHVAGSGSSIMHNLAHDGALTISSADSNYYYNNTFNETAYALVINDDAQLNYFEANHFQSDASNILSLTDGDSNTFINNNYYQESNNEIVRLGESTLTFINESFDKNNFTYVAATNGTAEFKWFLDVTINDGSNPISSALVEINQSNSSLVQNGSTDANGLWQINVSEGFVNESGWVYYTSHTIFANKTGYNSNSVTINLTETNSTATTISLTAESSGSSSSSSSSSSGGGGGGGGSASLTGSDYVKENWLVVDVDETTEMLIDNSLIAISSIEFGVKEKTYGAYLNVKQKDSLPSSVAGYTSGDVYQYLSITKSRTMTEDVLEDVKISFSVDKDWLSENGLQSTEIALFRYVDEQWVQLETTVVAVNGEYSYEAITPGFSYFMIAETDQAISSLVVEEAVVIEPEVDGSLIEVIDSDLGLVDAEESLLVDEGFDSKKLIRKIFPSLNSLYFTIMGLMILMIVITSIVLYRRSKEEFDEYSAVGRKDVVEMSKEVRSAVNDALIRAARKRKIKRRLKKEIDYNLDHK